MTIRTLGYAASRFWGIADGERGSSGDSLIDSLRDEKEGQQDDPPPEDQDNEGQDDQDDDQDQGDDADHGDEDDHRPDRQEAGDEHLSRGQQRIRNQARINREAEERARLAETALAEERARRDERDRLTQAAAAQREAEEERAAMAAMSDAERATYLMAKELKQLKNGQIAAERRTADMLDRSSFDNLLAAKPNLAKHRDKVERMYNDIQRSGGFLARKVILQTVLGEELLNGATTGRQRDEARGRVERERVQNRTPRGGAVPRGDNRKLSLVQRMERDDLKI